MASAIWIAYLPLLYEKCVALIAGPVRFDYRPLQLRVERQNREKGYREEVLSEL
jgi:hypothetical protein